MSDLISRQAAIMHFVKASKNYECGMFDLKELTHELWQIPSAQPERETGRWIRDEFGSRCGVCGLYAYRDKFDRPWESPCCPNCGAKMEVEHDSDLHAE